MTHAVQNTLARACKSISWLPQPAAPVDPVAELSTALGSGWNIARQTDYMGEVSIIAHPTEHNDARATFVFYEKDCLVHVGTVRADKWENDRGFTTFGQAVAMIITEATTLSISSPAAE
jgi:hypothetical protein